MKPARPEIEGHFPHRKRPLPVHAEKRKQKTLTVIVAQNPVTHYNSRVVSDFGFFSGKSGIQPFLEIRPSPSPAKFLAGFFGFGECLCSRSKFRIKPSQLTCQVAGVFAILISDTSTKQIQNSLQFHKFLAKAGKQ